ncbi:MAG: acetyl-CoA carboxylase carboxyl transferase subunit beta [Flammeovirgaceae bacterium]|nr:acetyl-CoA carboxylase carboxyl transferase subunit beta [Flammeovirgaceae bacterium]
MDWFKRKDKKIKEKNKKAIPDGLWEKCPSCSEILFKPELDKNLSVCHHCNYHFRMNFHNYIDLLFDEGSTKQLFSDLKSRNFLEFSAKQDYGDQLKDVYEKSGITDAIEIFTGKIYEQPIIMGIMNFDFIGGSMGSVVGEAVSRALVYARKNELPLIIICKSGGARMQEGAISLMQLAKTSAQLAKFSNDGGLYISILTDPTTGGVTASFGMLGDIILAEPGALIGFAGPRVIKQTIGQDLPKGFQRSEFLKEKGFIDQIVSRSKMKNQIYNIIDILN